MYQLEKISMFIAVSLPIHAHSITPPRLFRSLILSSVLYSSQHPNPVQVLLNVYLNISFFGMIVSDNVFLNLSIYNSLLINRNTIDCVRWFCLIF